MKKSIYIILLCLGITSCNASSDYDYSNSKKYTAASELTLVNQTIKKINLHWVSGDLKISQALDNTFSFKEEEQKDNLKMHYYLNDNELNIHFVKSGTVSAEYNKLDKDVEVVIPSSLEEFEIDIVDGDVDLNSSVKINDLDINSVDGDLKIDNISASEIEINKVDGNLNIYKFDIDKELDLDINSVSGEDHLYISEEVGYKLEDLSLKDFYSEYDNSLELGNKLIDISYSSVGGKLSIYKG